MCFEESDFYDFLNLNICTSTVLSSTYTFLPHTKSNNCERLYTLSGCVIKKCNNLNSVGPKSSSLPPSFTLCVEGLRVILPILTVSVLVCGDALLNIAFILAINSFGEKGLVT